jgi:hypothetical protein
MHFVHFFVILLIATLVMKYIVLPVFGMIALQPPIFLAPRYPKCAFCYGIVGAVLCWAVNLVWFGYVSYIVRGFSHVSSWFLLPVYCFMGTGAAISILSTDPDDSTGRSIWTVIFVVILGLVFIFVHTVSMS